MTARERGRAAWGVMVQFWETDRSRDEMELHKGRLRHILRLLCRAAFREAKLSSRIKKDTLAFPSQTSQAEVSIPPYQPAAASGEGDSEEPSEM